jgi:HEAT repeat protein
LRLLSYIQANSYKVIAMMKSSALVLFTLFLSGTCAALYTVEGRQSLSVDSFITLAVLQDESDAPADVKEKIKLLESPDANERATAACILGERRATAAIPALVKLLGDDTPTQRVQCGEGRARHGGMRELERSSPGKQAAEALAMIGTLAVEPLLAVVKSNDWRVRVNATCALGVIKDTRTVAAVLESLKDQDWRVREKAAWGLGLKNDERVAEALSVALRDSVWQVRRQAAWALGLQGDERSVEALASALRDEQSGVRQQAAWALGLKGDSRSVEALNRALQDQDWQVRSQAAWALGLKGGRSSVEPLIAALKDEQAHVRQQAAWALGLKGDRRAYDALNAALQDSAAPVRKNAAWALRLLRLKSGDLSAEDFRKAKADAEEPEDDPDVEELNADVNAGGAKP